MESMMGDGSFSMSPDILTQDVKIGHNRHIVEAEAAMVIDKGEPNKGS